MRNGNDGCGICGKATGALHVHHMEGYRNTALDDVATLITVCPKHHSSLERVTSAISDLSPSRRRHAALVVLGLLGDEVATHRGLRLLGRVSA
jgi:hypothetical protein